jgi:hypothetical protein
MLEENILGRVTSAIQEKETRQAISVSLMVCIVVCLRNKYKNYLNAVNPAMASDVIIKKK